MEELKLPRGKKIINPSFEGLFKNINLKAKTMKVIINNEMFEICKEKCKGKNLDLKICGFYVDLNYKKNVSHKFSSNNGGSIIAYEITNDNNNESCIPLVLSQSSVTPDFFYKELKESIIPYVK